MEANGGIIAMDVTPAAIVAGLTGRVAVDLEVLPELERSGVGPLAVCKALLAKIRAEIARNLEADQWPIVFEVECKRGPKDGGTIRLQARPVSYEAPNGPPAILIAAEA